MNTLLDKPIDEVQFTVFDVETTGLETYLGHRMCEIGLLKFRGTKELDSYSSLVNPERSIPEDVVDIHGITNEMVMNAPVFESIADDVLEFIKGTVLVAHNAEFDLGFIAKHLRRAKRGIPDNLVVDTLTLARKHFNFPGNSLETIASCLAIDTEGNHRALKDVTITREVFQHFIAKLKIKALKELLDLQGGSVPFPEVEEVPPPFVIDEAIKSGGKLLIKYVSASGEETERVVEPIEVDAHNGTEYLIAFCHLRNEERAFRIDRILESHPVASNS
ncbi:hypothetical protein CH333_02460 [candidate division WOR-3 bacterium JGI_Cruoil_03_44_89]|uniref:Exonuclease domain-containing protein n=1 Tax=candidate division WOR-3 bacterium JGI_Cruoil_03_44_89 TaxID=1973748 RepID=A0A235BX64_UNCW3|nr:MAG: hypothetical protein CH333_02460 [candidate division WOR-3 bacterium JGI_Cruoil_03_44_89]